MVQDVILPPALMWCDPGHMTGIAMLEDGRFRCGEWPFREAGQVVWQRCALWGPHLWAGYERYVITPATHKLTPQPEAMHMIGVIRLMTGAYGCRLLPAAQRGTAGWSPATPAWAEAIGIWPAGQDDAQSATLHMLGWLAREQAMPPAWREAIAPVMTAG